MEAADLTSFEPILVGSVEIRPGTRELFGPNGREVVEPKVMQVLLLLVAAKGEIVTRDRLVRECWDGRAVSEDAISRVIQRLRRSSESLGAEGFVIKTVHKAGYRLLVQNTDACNTSRIAPERVATDPFRVARRAFMPLAATLAAGVTGRWLLRRDRDERRVSALIAQSEQSLRSGLPDADARSVGFLEQAVWVQPDNALAWGRLALARVYVAESAPPDVTTAAVIAVQEAARRAREIDARQIDALAALAILPPYYGDWFAAEKRMDAVLARDAGHLPTRHAHDFMLSAVGRGCEGSRDRIKMAAADPLHSVYQTMLIFAHWTLGQVDEADRAADRALQLWPKNPGIWFAKFYTLSLTGRAERALAHLSDIEARPVLPTWLIETLRASGVALMSRQTSDIAKASARLVAEVLHDPSRSISAVTLLCGLGDIDRAFQVAEAYLLEQGSLMASLRWRRGQTSSNDERRRKTNMLFLPSSAPMRADRRFRLLMERTGLAEYWTRSGSKPDHLV